MFIRVEYSRLFCNGVHYNSKRFNKNGEQWKQTRQVDAKSQSGKNSLNLLLLNVRLRPVWKCVLESNTPGYSAMVYIKILNGLIRMARGENESDKLT